MTRILKHQLAFFLPLCVLLFHLSAPHTPLDTLLLTLPLIAAVALDGVASPERCPPAQRSGLPFDLTMLGLAALHLANLAGLVRLAATHSGGGADLLVGIILTGASTGYTAIVLAHELIHRKNRWWQRLGRLLLATSLYEHFYTEHLRGHHVRVATAADPATARFDESFLAFFARTVPAQLRSAWALEGRRVGAAWWRSRVLAGLLVGWGMLLLVGLWAGPVAAVAWAGQAFVGVLLLEVVNYFEHWGLLRRDRRVGVVDSWDAESWFTYYALVGLSRHADHHTHPSRPYPNLRAISESPKLPWGYFATAVVALFYNRLLRARLRAELARTGLGPSSETTHA